MKHFFFDLDDTVTESRQKISPEMRECLSKLENVIIISGATREQMLYQLDGLECIVMGQNGNETDEWKNELNEEEIEEVYLHLDRIAYAFSNYVDNYYEHFWNMDDLVENRGCQISFSLVGHHASKERKRTFDPTKEIRNSILKKVPFVSNRVEVKVAGTTCFDYTKKDGTKGKNIDRYIKEKGWNKEDCIYFGDNLQEGGNDETVIGVIETIEVVTPKDLMLKLKQYD